MKLVQLPRNEKSDSLRGAVLSIHNWKRFSSKFVLQSIFSFTNQLRKTLMQSRRERLVKRFAIYFLQVWGKNMKGVSCCFFLFKNQNACTLRLQLNIWKKLIACDCFKCFQRQLGLFVFSQKSEMTEKSADSVLLMCSWVSQIKSNFSWHFPPYNCTKKRKLTRKC